MASKRRKRRGDRSWTEERRYTVRGIRRDPLDIGKLSKALLGVMMAEEERQAEVEHAARTVEDITPKAISDEEARSGGEDDDDTR